MASEEWNNMVDAVLPVVLLVGIGVFFIPGLVLVLNIWEFLGHHLFLLFLAVIVSFGWSVCSAAMFYGRQ